MEAVNDLGGSTSRLASSRLHFPLKVNHSQSGASDYSKAQAGSSLLAMIKSKEESRRYDLMNQCPSIRSQKLKSMKKEQKIIPGNFMMDQRNHKRKERLAKEFVTDSIKLRQHHTKKSKKILKEILLTLKKFNELELEVEQFRQDLALRPDFVLAQFFSYLDVASKSKISLLEFYNGLYDLGITPNKEDLAILLKEFDQKSRGVLDYEDFFRMISPRDKQFKSILIERHKRAKPRNFEDVNFPF
jgi:hypothetical protein